MKKKQVKKGSKYNLIYRLFLPLSFVGFLMQACDENKFPVSPVPPPFEFIPPNDVNMLAAQGGDQQVTLTWGAAKENALKAIHAINETTGEEIVLPGTAGEVTFTGLTNYVKYTFKVRTESFEDQLSLGVTIATKPFTHDNVKPDAVVNLIGYKLGDGMAFAVWGAPKAIDVKDYIVALGDQKITVDGETTNSVINGDLNLPLKVYAVDYSGNISDATDAYANAPVVTIDGFDDGTTETIRIHKDPIIAAVDGYIVSYFDGEYKSSTSPLPEVYTQTMPVNNGQPLWLNAEKTDGSWNVPVKVTLLSGGREISTYDYLSYNDVPGTIMLTMASYLNGEPDNVRRNNDGNAYSSLLGNFGGLPYPDGVYGIYPIKVLEDGEYEVTMYFSNEANKKFSFSIDGAVMVEGLTGPTNSANWDTYIPAPPVTMSLTAGEHELRVNLTSGGCNYQKVIFKKK